MANITAKLVAELREKTGSGMMDCKKALVETDGDMEKAIAVLREKGLAAAAKRSGRIAAEGLVIAKVDDAKNVGVVLEVNSETDFVAKNEQFAEFAQAVANTVINENPADVDALANCKLAGSDQTVAEELTNKISTIGENLKIRRFERLEGNLIAYTHGDGRIGVIVEIETDIDPSNEEVKQCGKDVALQVTAMNPQYLNKDSVPAETIESEKEILRAQVVKEGKPEHIADKIVMGKMSKFYKENCLLEQAFIKDGDIDVKKYVDGVASSLGGTIKIVNFVRYEKGEGLQKRDDNFADEVAEMMK